MEAVAVAAAGNKDDVATPLRSWMMKNQEAKKRLINLGGNKNNTVNNVENNITAVTKNPLFARPQSLMASQSY